MVKPISLWPVPMSLRLSTEPPVTSAVACTPGRYLVSTFAMAAAERVIDAARAAGADREGLLLRLRPGAGKEGCERNRKYTRQDAVQHQSRSHFKLSF